ncbi:tetratricopeptide repeat protein [Pelagovum pacificum]|uniref:Tetratricopeptide repeat protein n=1 Tax=Pelagovum pacificum TaxID=2588711 RepID=A0A5C5G9B9_9RHOB|nr:tetratricopeptide repeat protein [Pelagovum pacificum]QQA42085.1 tetratricopeptide repeat protein [Pelagovum pacificum]TNY31173.1 tetratricopeptide repeat protein [Pelagovum pacificum]
MPTRSLFKPLALALLTAALPGIALATPEEDCRDASLAAEDRIFACNMAIERADDEDRFSLLIESGRAYYGDGRYDEAEEAARAAMALKPSSHLAPLDLSWIEQARGESEAALAWVEQAFELAPTNPWVLEQFILVLRDVDRIPECVPYAVTLTSVAPRTDFHMFGTIAQCMQDTDHFEEAVVAYEVALSLGEDIGWANGNLARALWSIDRYEEAAEAGAIAVEADPGNTYALATLIDSLARLGRLDEAVTVFEAHRPSYREAEDAEDVHNYIGWPLYLAGRFDEGRDVMEEWRLDRPSADEWEFAALDTLAHIYAALGEQTRARRYFLASLDSGDEAQEALYRDRLAALGIEVGLERRDLEAAIGDCVNMGAECRLYDPATTSYPF